jgi:hypothetical protein
MHYLSRAYQIKIFIKAYFLMSQTPIFITQKTLVVLTAISLLSSASVFAQVDAGAL